MPLNALCTRRPVALRDLDALGTSGGEQMARKDLSTPPGPQIDKASLEPHG